MPRGAFWLVCRTRLCGGKPGGLAFEPWQGSRTYIWAVSVEPWSRYHPPAHGETAMDNCITWPGRAQAGLPAWAWFSSAGMAWRWPGAMVKRAEETRPAAPASVPEEEAELLARVAAGHRGAPLEELYDRYARRLYALGLRLLGSQGLAEELVQETFVRLWQQARRFDPERGSVGTFVFAIARRLAIDLRRRQSVRPTEVELPEDQATSSDQVEALIDSLTIRDALQLLTPRHREVLELYLVEGRKQTEIAELLDLPVGTVKTRTYHAVRAFRLALEECGIHA
jgi:RNA polymerase sigma-70 factor, ECF subfamily